MTAAAGAVKYVEFVLHPTDVFDEFVAAAARVGLDAIVPAGGGSEPVAQQEPTVLKEGEQRRCGGRAAAVLAACLLSGRLAAPAACLHCACSPSNSCS